MGIVGDISNLIQQGYSVWKERHEGNTVSPQEMFDKYVNPSYQILKQVHGDYMDMYLELLERIAIDSNISQATIFWFSKARVRHQADRSELRSIALPKLDKISSSSINIQEVGNKYISSITNYFLPIELKESSSAKRIHRRTPSASSFTAARLHVLKYWSRLSYESKLVFAAEEYLENNENLDREHLINGLIDVFSDIKNDKVIAHLNSVESEANETLQSVSNSMQEAIMKGRFSWVIKGFAWRDILEEHIHAQCRELEKSLEEIQKAYFQFRILTDRQ